MTGFPELWNRLDRATQIAALRLADDTTANLNDWNMPMNERDALLKRHSLLNERGESTDLHQAFYIVHTCRRLGRMDILK